ncbi:phage baseplate assembly protein V [Campylobacter sputorum]|uniref:phage baseplate assembly protein V n=1 Tax=Campylobacter sputorum TaxID=206 RepID=UPI00068C9A31|nr:phage baseplate assembly protein V [Campylobacter sputorum]
MISLGIIKEVNSNKSLVRVDYQGTISEFIPYVTIANSYKKHFIPPRINEQVILIKCDNGDLKFAIGSFFSRRYKEPSGANQTTEVIEYEDGTTISYDTKTSTLNLTNPKTINLICSNAMNITVPTINLNGDLIVSGNITDSRGDLTGHSHSDSDGATSLPR